MYHPETLRKMAAQKQQQIHKAQSAFSLAASIVDSLHSSSMMSRSYERPRRMLMLKVAMKSDGLGALALVDMYRIVLRKPLSPFWRNIDPDNIKRKIMKRAL